jgi:hypothetical protein
MVLSFKVLIWEITSFNYLVKTLVTFFAKSIPNKIKTCERSLITESKRIEEKI